MNELNFLSAVEMAEQVRARAVSPVELVDAHLGRIAELNARRDPQLNAFVHVDVERARERAKIAEAAVGPGARSRADTLGALHGVPISVKSSVDVAGWPCECGSRLRRGYVPAEDATLVTRLRAAGAILLGNTNVPEFLMAYETDNALYGRTNSPWDLERTPGGSSGGEAAAIAAGCSAGGVGSDGGGSIRIPAHYTGICGLKPTPGRVPSSGHYPVSAGPFSQLGVVGPMARTVADLARLFAVMAGPDIGDPASAPVPLRVWSDSEILKLRVAYFENDGVTPVTPETAAAVRAAAEALRAQGFQVEAWRPQNLDRVWQLWWNLFGRARQMETFPILICPACAVPAFRHGEREWMVQGRKVEYLKAMSYSQWFNLLGNPAAVVPVGRSPEGLPIGVQIVGRPWEDEAVLAVAAKIEAASGGFRRPPIA